MDYVSLIATGVLLGPLPASQLYPAGLIKDHGGAVQLYPDPGAETKIDPMDPRVVKAFEEVDKIKVGLDPNKPEDAAKLVEGIGKIMLDHFGPYDPTFYPRWSELKETSGPDDALKRLYLERSNIVRFWDQPNDLGSQKTGTFICSEYGSIGAMLCDRAGLKTFVFTGVFFNRGQLAEEQSLEGSSHHSVLVLDSNDNVLGFAEFARGPHNEWMEQNAYNQYFVSPLQSITLNEFVSGKPFYGYDSYSKHVYSMENPLGFSLKADFFQHQQFTGDSYDIKAAAAEKLGAYYQPKLEEVFDKLGTAPVVKFIRDSQDNPALGEAFLEISGLGGETLDGIQNAVIYMGSATKAYENFKRTGLGIEALEGCYTLASDREFMLRCIEQKAANVGSNLDDNPQVSSQCAFVISAVHDVMRGSGEHVCVVEGLKQLAGSLESLNDPHWSVQANVMGSYAQSYGQQITTSYELLENAGGALNAEPTSSNITAMTSFRP